MSIYTPLETTQELYGEAPLDPSTGEQVWWDEEGGPWTDYIFDSSDEEEDEEDLFPSDSEDTDSEDSDSEFDPESDEEQDQELMECSCCGNIWDGNAQIAFLLTKRCSSAHGINGNYSHIRTCCPSTFQAC